MQPVFRKIEARIISIHVQGNLAVLKSKSEIEDRTEIDFHLHPTTPLFSSYGDRIGVTAIPVKSKISAYIDSLTPLPMVHPIQIKPLVVIIEQEGTRSQFGVGIFDEQLYSEHLKLKLNIHDETKIVDLKGNSLEAASLKNSFLYVFYDATTRSIPAQTTPNKIIVVKDEDLPVFDS